MNVWMCAWSHGFLDTFSKGPDCVNGSHKEIRCTTTYISYAAVGRFVAHVRTLGIPDMEMGPTISM
jgi:hypothetical protein